MVIHNRQGLFNIPDGLRSICVSIPGQTHRANSAQPARKLLHRVRTMLQAGTKNGLSNEV